MRSGAELRQARQRLGWSLEEVGEALRIKPAFLQALEDGRPGGVPGSAYALGFLRTYAAAMGLNPDEVARRFRSEAAEVNHQTKLAFPVPVPERGVPAGALILIGLVLAMVAYGGWYKLSGEAPTTTIPVPPVLARLAPLAPVVTPSPQVAAIAPTAGLPPTGRANSGQTAASQTATSQAGSGAMPTPGLTPAPTAVPATSQLATNPATGAMAVAGLPATPAPGANAGSATGPGSLVAPEPSLPPTQASAMPVPNPQPPASRITLHATADTWLQVSGPDGKILLSRVLHNGESWAVPSQPGLELTTGNAGGLVVEVDGTDIPPLGGPGVVKHNIPLDPSALTALAAATPPATATPAATPTAATPASAPAAAAPTH